MQKQVDLRVLGQPRLHGKTVSKIKTKPSQDPDNMSCILGVWDFAGPHSQINTTPETTYVLAASLLCWSCLAHLQGNNVTTISLALGFSCNQHLQSKLMHSCNLKWYMPPCPWLRMMHVYHLLNAANTDTESNFLKSTKKVEWTCVDTGC